MSATPGSELGPYIDDVKIALARARLDATDDEQVVRVARAWRAWSTALGSLRARLRAAGEEPEG